jgi:hypothetical protein
LYFPPLPLPSRRIYGTDLAATLANYRLALTSTRLYPGWKAFLHGVWRVLADGGRTE